MALAQIIELKSTGRHHWTLHCRTKKPLPHGMRNQQTRVAACRFVKVVTVNIYRTAHESFQTFDYIADTGNFR